jgi:hypothetical protein
MVATVPIEPFSLHLTFGSIQLLLSSSLPSSSSTPSLSHFGETLTGLPTLRAFGDSVLARWTNHTHVLMDASSKAFLAQKAVDR